MHAFNIQTFKKTNLAELTNKMKKEAAIMEKHCSKIKTNTMFKE